MANAFAAGATGASWDLLTETAFDREVEFALRDMPQWRPLIDKRPERQAMPGDVVTFTIHQDLANLATTPLTETVDPDAVAPQAPIRVSVTVNEYGNSTLKTERLEATAFTQPSQELVEILARNQADTFDALVRGVADTSTNVFGSNAGAIVGSAGTAGAVVQASDTMRRDVVAAGRTLLERDKVVPKIGQNYLAVAHGDVLYDLMRENSATAWNAPHTVGGDTQAIYTGDVGSLAGVSFISTNRVTIAADGATSGKVYRSYCFGKQAIAEVVAIEPHTVVGNQTDKLKRFYPLGWYGLLGWSLYRPQALRKCFTSSSLATLT